MLPLNHINSALPRFATIPSWCSISGMSRTATYRALAAGHLVAIKCGNRTLLDVPHGLNWLESLPRAEIRCAA